MGRKLPHTPRSQIRSALRQLFLRSREHAATLKLANSTCQCCGKKKSTAKGKEVKIHVHHLNPIQWELMFAYIYRHLLCHPSEMMALCESCHLEAHEIMEEGPK